MHRSLVIAALMCSTALTPAQAGPLIPFLSGLGGAFAGTAPLVGTSFLAGSSSFAAGAFIGQGALGLVGGALGRLALSSGLSAIARKLGPKTQSANASARMVNYSQAITPIEWVFGQVRKGGPYAVRSFQTPTRYYGVILAAHEITAVDQWYLDNRPVEVVDGAVTTAPYPPYMKLRAYLGGAGQVADAAFVAAIPEWTSAHDMAGLAYVAAEISRPPDNLFSDILGNSPPTGPAVTPVIRGAKVYDPRTATTDYSNNAALVWAWIIENRLGEGSVDWDKVAIEADAADVFVTNRTGGTQRKWTLNGSFPDDVDFSTLFDQIIIACDGKSYETPEGKIGFYVGRYIEPTITLTDDDIRSATLAVRDFGQDPFTEFVAEYIEPANDFIEAPSATLVVDALSRVNRSTVPMGFVNSHNQAFRAMKRISKSTRAQYVMRCEVGIIGLELMDQRFVRINAVGVEFVAEIADWQPGADDASFVLELVSVTSSDFDFDAATEEPEPPARDAVTNDNSVQDPSGLVGAAVDGPGIEWSWNSQSAELLQEFRFREVGAAEWQPVVTIRDGATDIITPGLVDGASYEAELRNVTSARRPSSWIASASVQAVANSTPPLPVIGFAATVDGSAVDLTWTTSNDPLHVSTRLYRAVDSTDFADAVLIESIFGGANVSQEYADTSLSPETYVYWAASVNVSGVEGALAGPVSATVI